MPSFLRKLIYNYYLLKKNEFIIICKANARYIDTRTACSYLATLRSTLTVIFRMPHVQKLPVGNLG